MPIIMSPTPMIEIVSAFARVTDWPDKVSADVAVLSGGTMVLSGTIGMLSGLIPTWANNVVWIQDAIRNDKKYFKGSGVECAKKKRLQEKAALMTL